MHFLTDNETQGCLHRGPRIHSYWRDIPFTGILFSPYTGTSFMYSLLLSPLHHQAIFFIPETGIACQNGPQN